MIQKTEIEQARFRLLKTARTAIRLRHALAADDELNAVLPELQAAFDKSVQRGELPDDTTIREMVQDVFDG